MSKDRIEIEKAENGYSITVWGGDDSEKDEYGYSEPKRFVATEDEEVLKLVKKHLG